MLLKNIKEIGQILKTWLPVVLLKLKKRLPNEKIIFEKNEHYYNAKEVELEELVYITSDNDLTVYNM